MNLKDTKLYNTDSKPPEALKQSFRNLMEPLLILFNKAAGMVLKNKQFYIAYSIPGGVYGYFKDHSVSTGELEAIADRIRIMIEQREKFRHEVLPLEKILRYFEANQRKDIIHLIKSKPFTKEPEGLRLAHLNGFGELLINYIQNNYDRLQSFRLVPFHQGFFLIADPDFFDRTMPSKPETSKYFHGFEETEQTMMHLGVGSFAELNDIIRQEKLPEFIKLSEAWQARQISVIAENILNHPDNPRLVFLAGPTSSGKTTSANRLAIELKVMKKEVLILSLDHYYLPHSAIPDDPVTGIKNFEQINALNLELFNKEISELLDGKEVHLSRYHFDGRGASPEKKTTKISPETYIIVEGIHGLNPELWDKTMETPSYRLYVSALSTLNIHDHLPLSTSDHRLIRRLVRDHLFRGYSFNETVRRWPDVVQNEYHSIFPFQESAHAIFNSALIYELAVFAHYAPAIADPEKAENEQIREETKRLNRILSLLIPINPLDIPPTSILREFIGGSSFQYS
ncbi:MAG: uridine kinase [Bacteroidales bacterium]